MNGKRNGTDQTLDKISRKKGSSRRLKLAILTCGWLLAGEWPAMAATPKKSEPTIKKSAPAMVWSAVAEYAMQRNPRIQAAIASLEVARQRYGNQSLADLLPQVTTSATYTATSYEWASRGKRGDIGATGSVDPTVFSANLSQPLFNLKAWLTYRQGDPMIAAYLQELESARQTVLMQVAEMVIGVLQAEEVTLLAKANHEVAKHHLEATQARYQVGEISRTDVSQAESNAATAQAEVTRTINDVAVAKAKYAEVVGDEPPAKLAVPWLKVEDLLNRSQEAETKDLEGRPDILSRIEQKRAAEMGIDMANAGHMPTLRLTSTVNRRLHHEIPGFGPDHGDPLNEYVMGVEFSLPIYAGGRITSQRDQAMADRDTKLAELDRMRLQAIREMAQAKLDYLTEKSNDQAYLVAERAANEALQGTLQEYQVGTRTSLDILDSQSKLYAAQTNLAKNRYAMILSQFRLLNALGRLTMDEVHAHKGSPPSDYQFKSK